MTTEPAPRPASRRVGLRILITVALVLLAGVIFVIFYVVQQTQKDTIPLGAPSGELAYTSNEGGWNIYALGTDGAARLLTADGDEETPDGKHDYFASWSFEGDMLNFLTARTGEMGPAQVNPDGSELRTLSVAEAIMSLFGEGRLDWDPAWSPADAQGQIRVGWSSLRDLNLELYMRTGNDGERIRLTNTGARDWFMSWSPDGTQILFSSDREGNENIYRMNVDTLETTQLTDDPLDDLHPVWALNGESILFLSERLNELKDGFLDLYVMNLDGSDQHPLGVDEVFSGDPTYSADGQQIAYMSNEEGDWNIYVMDVDGNNVSRLTEGSTDELFPVWRPVPADEAGS